MDHSSVCNSGSSTNISFHFHVDFGLNNEQAGNIAFRIAPDFGLGGEVFLDDAPIAFNNTDMWWAGSLTNSNETFQFNKVLSVGNHTLDVYGQEECCDGDGINKGYIGQFKLPGTNDFISFSNNDNINKVVNNSPTINSFTATPKAGNPPLTVNFVATANDPDGSISAYQWDFTGDGRLDDTTTTGKTSHTYNDLGTFAPNVTIVDNKGAKIKSNSIPITVQYGPDLVGKVESYSFTDKTNTIHIDFNVTNAGDIPSPQFPVTFNLSSNGTKVLSTFKNMTVNGLATGESKMLSVDYTFNGSIYGQYVLVLVDPAKNAAEVDETNNGTRIVVQPMPTK